MVIKIRRKDYVYGMKPYGWIKGSVLTFLGLLLTRWGIGNGRVTFNIYFGLPIYFLIASSTLLVSLVLKIEDEERLQQAIKKIEISSAILFSLAFGTAIYHTLFYNLELLNLFILAIIGALLILSTFFGKNWKHKSFLANVLIGLAISLGIIYGAALNRTFIPISVFLFFGTVFLLQFSKDLINESKNEEKYKTARVNSLALILGPRKTQIISLSSEIIVILFIILTIVLNSTLIHSVFLYILSMIITAIIIGLAAILTFLMKAEKTYYRLVKNLLRVGMFFVFATIFLASF
jgi:4-hydroxybenzoate polyprenyltransferase